MKVSGFEELQAYAGEFLGGLMPGTKATLVLEWPERVTEIVPQDAIRLRFDMDGEARIITRT